MSLIELMKAFYDGDKKSLGLMCKIINPLVIPTIIKRLQFYNQTDINEIIQNMYIVALMKIDSFRFDFTEEMIIKWFRRIAINATYNYRRRWHHQYEYMDKFKIIDINEFINFFDSVEKTLLLEEDDNIYKSMISSALLKMKPLYREIILWHKIEEKSLDEISEIMNLSQEEIRKEYKKAYKEMQIMINNPENYKDLQKNYNYKTFQNKYTSFKDLYTSLMIG